MFDTAIAEALHPVEHHSPTPAAATPSLAARPAAGSTADAPGAAVSAATNGALLGAVLDEIDYGVMVVDAASGTLLHANRLALEEVGLHRTLDVVAGRVTVADAVGQRALTAALLAVRQGRRMLLSLKPPSPAVPAETAQDDPSRVDLVQVSVVPIASESAQPRALLVFGKRQVADALSVGFFARAHALTPTEDAVLLGLCRGLKPTQIAVDHGVAISTVRTHVNSIRVKTGTSSIRELVNRVSTLPPMAPALRRCTH